MPTNLISFKKPDEPVIEFQDLLNEFSLSLWKNGQSLCLPTVLFEAHTVKVVISSPTRSALETRHLSEYSISLLNRLEKIVGPSTISVLDDTNDKDSPHIESMEELDEDLLLDPFLNSPLRGVGGIGVPLFLLPTTDDSRERLWSWSRSYTLVKELEECSGPLEFESYREIAEPFSLLNRSGQVWARELSKLLGKRVFYVLNRLYGAPLDSLGERVCPVCSNFWTEGLGQDYPFLCERCSILSTEPYERGEDIRGPIGTWHPGIRLLDPDT